MRGILISIMTGFLLLSTTLFAVFFKQADKGGKVPAKEKLITRTYFSSSWNELNFINNTLIEVANKMEIECIREIEDNNKKYAIFNIGLNAWLYIAFEEDVAQDIWCSFEKLSDVQQHFRRKSDVRPERIYFDGTCYWVRIIWGEINPIDYQADSLLDNGYVISILDIEPKFEGSLWNIILPVDAPKISVSKKISKKSLLEISNNSISKEDNATTKGCGIGLRYLYGYSLGEVIMNIDIRCLRSVANGYYAPLRLVTGRWAYIHFSKENKTYVVDDVFYEQPLTKNTFEELTPNQSTFADVCEIDAYPKYFPYVSIVTELSSSHQTSDGFYVTIKYDGALESPEQATIVSVDFLELPSDCLPKCLLPIDSP